MIQSDSKLLKKTQIDNQSDSNDWKLLKVTQSDSNDWKLLKVTQHDSKWLKVTQFNLKYLKVTQNIKKKNILKRHNNSKSFKVAQSQGTTGGADPALYSAYGGRWRPAEQ